MRERQQFDGKKAAPPFDDGVRVFLVKRGQNPPSLAAAGVGGARSLPWLLRAGHSGLELVGARAAKTSRGASNTR